MPRHVQLLRRRDGLPVTFPLVAANQSSIQSTINDSSVALAIAISVPKNSRSLPNTIDDDDKPPNNNRAIANQQSLPIAIAFADAIDPTIGIGLSNRPW